MILTSAAPENCIWPKKQSVTTEERALPSFDLSRMTQLLFLLPLIGCEIGESRSAHLEALLDFSQSMDACSGRICDPYAGAVFFETFVAWTGLPRDSRVGVYKVAQDRTTPCVIDAVGPHASPGHGTRAARIEFKKMVEEPLVSVGTYDVGSGVFHAIWAASERFQETPGTDDFLGIYSDFRDVDVDGRWALDEALLTPDEVLRDLTERNMIPRLAGVRVWLCGFHASPAAGLDWTPTQHRQLRALVEAYFEATGAESLNITESCRVGGWK